MVHTAIVLCWYASPERWKYMSMEISRPKNAPRFRFLVRLATHFKVPQVEAPANHIGKVCSQRENRGVHTVTTLASDFPPTQLLIVSFGSQDKVFGDVLRCGSQGAAAQYPPYILGTPRSVGLAASRVPCHHISDAISLYVWEPDHSNRRRD
jgi:hypothetical protein